jgi:hypothetical protein
VNQVGNELARAQKSIIFCMEMSDISAQDACKFGVIMTEVSEKNDSKLCDSLSDGYKRSCLMTFVLQDAMSSDDITKCDTLNSLTQENENV